MHSALSDRGTRCPLKNDLELLRTYEPILRFTHGELFFPCSVAGYVEECALFEGKPEGDHRQLVDWGDLDLKRLGDFDDAEAGHQLYLRFVERPLDGRELARWLIREERPVFQARGRLARVGLGIRTLDSLFGLGMLLSGRVPGGVIAAAERKYRAIRERHPGYPYYGRVLRQGEYTVLHYMYFYAMNDWRSTFHGVNDHEADWEQVFIFLEETADGHRPLWVAASVHEFDGQDLRRRWDDPELEREGNHPVLYAAAGSHANYFQAGEYLARYEVEFLKPVTNTVDRIRQFWTRYLRQGDPSGFGERIAGLLRFPYVDYARGDGNAIGPGQADTWAPTVLTDETGWAERYRGLWGLATSDLFEGQSGPAGPKFHRDGRVRQTWSNPVGWTGLHKVATPATACRRVEQRLEALRDELRVVKSEAHRLEDRLPVVGLETDALGSRASLRTLWEERRAERDELEAELNSLIARRDQLIDTSEALQQQLERMRAGDFGDPRAHIRQVFAPQSQQEIQQSRLVETWAAVSVGLILAGFAGLLFFYPERWILGGIALVVVFLGIDIALRRHVTDLIVVASILLAFATAGVLVYEFFFQIVVLVVAALSLLIIVENFREIRGR